MKQRIAVRAVVKDGAKMLLLRRATGRESILGKLELPGGRVLYDEQPEDALRRILQADIGIQSQSFELYDVVTYIDRDDRDVQYVVIMYTVELAPGGRSVKLGVAYNKYIWHPLYEIQHNGVTDLTALMLGILQQETATSVDEDRYSYSDDKNTSKAAIVVYSDGGSRGNPGPSAAGFVIINGEHEVVEQGGEYLGVTTSNQAEYHGVRLGLERARELGYATVDFRVDSMLIVNQLNGVYKIKNRELWPIHERIKRLVESFESVRFSHVKREFNRLADGMVNKTLDAHANKSSGA